MPIVRKVAQRLVLAFVVAGAIGGCCTGWPPAVPTDAGCPVDGGATTLACDLAAPVDPSAVVDLASFRSEASAAVCDLSLRCRWGVVGDSFCSPSFAARVGASGATFDLATARACVAQLATTRDCDDALTVASACYQLNAGRTDFVAEGASCACGRFGCFASCSFGMACVGGACTRTAGIGAPCDDAHPCEISASCRAGTCAIDDLRCATGCAPGMACSAGACVPAICSPLGLAAPHHVGCGCARDDDCPADVARCVGGTCVLRPIAGQGCTTAGPPCFGARCDGATCVPFGVGQGPCGLDIDCSAGLVCGALDAVPQNRTCGSALLLGAACGAGVPGRCVGGFCNGSTCTPFAQRGEPCRNDLTAPLACAPGLNCAFVDATATTTRCE